MGRRAKYQTEEDKLRQQKKLRVEREKSEQ